MTNHQIKLDPQAVYYHITHWKAGSQWIRALLNDALGAAVVQPRELVKHAYDAGPIDGKVYPCCYLTELEFCALPPHPKRRRFVLIRDLRDTLISGYFSLRNSHSLIGQVEKHRWFLNRWGVEDGLLYLLDTWLHQTALIQRSWLASSERVFKLEHFMKDGALALREALTLGWEVEASPLAVEQLVARHAFAKYSGGRHPGEEDAASHYRKGIHGDWRQHFTDRVRERFKVLYNDIILTSGYETTADWA